MLICETFKCLTNWSSVLFYVELAQDWKDLEIPFGLREELV